MSECRGGLEVTVQKATTADAAKEQGFPRVVVAPTPDDAGLLRAIEEAVFGKWPVA